MTPDPAELERVALAIEATMFAPHELPLPAELHAKYLETARAAIAAQQDVGEADWRTDIENAPKDGSDVLFPIETTGRAFWCEDQKRWVLKYQFKMDYINHPTRWRLPRPEAQRDNTVEQ